jgi:hypothetical protein
MNTSVVINYQNLLKSHFRKHTDNTFLLYYLEQADIEICKITKNCYIEWSDMQLAQEACDLFYLAYHAIDETKKDNIFPSWLDDYIIQLRFSSATKQLRGALDRCEACRHL